jgi:superfamily II DNA or RNA helicase
MSAATTTLDRTVAPGDPRPYQIDAMKAAWLAWSGERRPTGTGCVSRILITMATGGGKTFIFTRLAKEFLDLGLKVIVLVHREDLALQAFNHMHSAAPGANIGMVMGSLFNDVDADIIIASVPTLVNRNRLEQITARGLIIADEAHLSPAPGWYSVIEGLGGFDGRAKVAGFTATPFREDGKPLIGGRKPIFEENVFTWDILDGIRSGWLSDLDAYQWRVKSLDLIKVSQGRGDMSAEDLGDALLDADAGPEIVKAYLDPEKGGLREDGSFRPFLLFTPNVATAFAFADDFNAAGVPVETVTGETPGQCKERIAGRPADCCGACRQAIYDRYRSGETVGLVNCMVLTVGFDMPKAEVAIIARQTTSKGLYRQMVGRITRKCFGKLMGRIIDVVGVTDRLDLASPADIIGAPVEEGETLKDAVERKDREEKEAGFESAVPDSEKGDLVSEAVNLFEQSSSMFLQSPKGYWFVPVSDALYYLQPLSGGLFSVCRLPKGGKRIRKVGRTKVTDAVVLESRVTEEWGKLWIESYAREEDPSISSKSASWRSKRDPTVAQVEFLDKQGYDYPEDYETRSEASNLMSQIIAGWQGL